MNSLLKNYFILYVLQQSLWGLKFNFNIFNAKHCCEYLYKQQKNSHDYCFLLSTILFYQIDA